ncbi:GCN5 family acetyltransferase [Micromonospora rosaria]|uniref:GCN5 family acetyltransferase n=1 Tax=Micromonospora rosaria TaxID=47874 RepID=A0A136PV07_9ACTN|nr:GNAT family N-acetyltransferase [Micromonospora rosaria]KXK62245.1 GCN5 family acetyltransferase [Micromonospora rosaria]
MAITITPIRADDPAAIDEAYRIAVAAVAADIPDFPPLCPKRFTGNIRHPLPARVPIWALARLDGVPAGYLALDLYLIDNTDGSGLDLMVHPAYRRRGVGRALHEYAVRLLRERGRKWSLSSVVSTLPGGAPRPEAGTAFATAMGAVAALPEVRRRLDVTRLDQGALDAALAEARDRATGYRVVHWQQHTPPEYLADIAYLDGRLLMDAPLGDLVLEPQVVDAERIRGTERALDARGRRRYHHGALHVDSGRVVAWTTLDLGVSPSWHAFQQITIVDPEHRGRRLGLLVKVENLRYTLAHEPGLRAVDTFNAAANEYMIAVNERLGFRPVDAWADWQQTI